MMRDSNRPDEYLKWVEKALELRPDYPEAQWERALALLTLGDYGRGLPAYEARWGLERSPPRTFDKPRWDGQPLSGQTLFLHDEQGFGDAIQFARFAAQAAARGARVVLECQPELMRLFASLPGVAELVARGAPAPAFDCYAPLLSLPGLFGTTLDTLPALVPYLAPPEDRPIVLPSERRRKIGLVWAGKTTPRDRSIALGRLIDLMGDPRLAFYGLQVGPRAADIQAEAAGALITDLSAHLTDFAATAAVLSQLDVLVTIDTAIAHLAGALGVPTYVLLLYHSDWRWGAAGTATPWYPSLKLFRQARFDDWQAPLLDVARDLRRVAEGQPPLG
ncbi:MAG: hypothetical protein IT565_12590 [Rhodospirillales bacterium]|nr:hypothetical protein [Rhodospirillales bacterium]